MLPGYAELHCLTNFSFLRGASHPEELVERAAALGYAALAITDECSLAGVVRAHLAARETKLKIIVGTEVHLVDGPQLVLLATHREGYGNLSGLITKARRRAEKGEYRLERKDLDDALPGCLALLVPSLAGVPSLPLQGGGPGWGLGVHHASTSPPAHPPRPHPDLSPGRAKAWRDVADALWLAARFPGRAWIAAELHLDGTDRARLGQLCQLSAASGLPLVAAGDVHMHVRSRKPVQDVLTAIRIGKPVAECGEALFPNAERHLRLRVRLARLHPPELLAETLRIAERCTFSLDEIRYEYPEEIVPSGETPSSWLRKLTEAGLRWRFAGGPGPEAWRAPSPSQGEGGDGGAVDATSQAPLQHDLRTPTPALPLRGGGGSALPSFAEEVSADPTPPDVRALVEHELALIADLRYEAYFLTVFDIVRFARESGILCQGRGSAANSAVCYALGITEVDPARMSMLFERFISKERNEPPDIDVDFEHQRREEVIQYIYRKYGRDRAALTATVISYRTKSAIRDVGKALGMDLAQVDALAKSRAWWDGVGLRERQLAGQGFDPSSPVVRQLVALVAIIVGFPRHLSQHTGGFVIARGPLSRLVPIENAAMPERSVIQWDKDDLDALGLLKVDVLALGMLSAIRRALALVAGYRGTPFGIADVPPEDPGVYGMVSRADTVGVFQIESRAQMSMLPRLRPRCFFDLVIEVAIVRPGPIQGGMVHPYLRRRNGEEPVSYPSEAVRKVLERTLGVPIFQEQVMQLAVVAAGFTPGEADRLRRAMAAWRRRGGLEPFEQRLKEGMRARGYPEAFAEQIYRQILGFGEYGFPESHSASFALLVYVSCWLKRYEPAAFTAALLNSQPMGFYAPSQLVQDAQRHGVEVRAVDVTRSEWECGLELGAPSPPQEEGGDGGPADARKRTPLQRDTCTPTLTLPLEGGGKDHAPTLLPDGGGNKSEPSSSSRSEAYGRGGPAIRLGFLMIKGLSEEAAQRIVAARRERPFASVADLARRARLDAGDLKRLAAANALAALAPHRRRAYWDVVGVETRPHVLREAPVHEAEPALVAPTEGEDLVADYASIGLTLGRHPLALLRDRLRAMRLSTADEIRSLPHGRLARASGIVTGRQRPDTASGVVFVTLEDETGYVNVVVWSALVERQRRELLGSRLMTVYGVIEREGEVVHLVARRLVDHTALLGRLMTRSRDFH
jgi:error-prone DNA polymerase